MRPLLLYLTCVLLLSPACKTQTEVACEGLICTQEFRMISLKMEGPEGKPLAVSEFSSVNKRTGESMLNKGQETPFEEGTYTVASDANLKELSETGDTIHVSAKDPQSGLVKQAVFVISGGRCVCHISKISGPEKLIFE